MYCTLPLARNEYIHGPVTPGAVVHGDRLGWFLVEWGLEERMLNWDVLWDFGALTVLTDCLYR